jgi:hypothetical protein
MFKKLVPVVALALIAGPVLAADPPASSGTTTTSANGKHHHKSHHHSSSKAKPASTDTSNAPAK